jgi:hypothetical protein
MNGNKYSSPLVLVRKSGIEKMKELDLEKHFAIPGYFLSLALKMAVVLRYLSRNGESVDIEKVKDAAECRFNRQKTGVEYHRLEPAGGSDENEISDRKGEDSNGKFIWIKVPVLFELQDSNDLLKISDLRKVVVPGDRVPESEASPFIAYRKARPIRDTRIGADRNDAVYGQRGFLRRRKTRENQVGGRCGRQFQPFYENGAFHHVFGRRQSHDGREEPQAGGQGSR